MRVILHPLWLPYQLQSIKAVELESRERLDAQAAKIDLFASQSKVVQVLLRRPARYFLRFPIFRSWIEEESKKDRQGLG